jgi:hypothetical protein
MSDNDQKTLKIKHPDDEDTEPSIDFETKGNILQKTDKREASTRFKIDDGHAVIYNQSGKILCKAELKNISLTGVGVELLSLDLARGAMAIIDLEVKGLIKILSVKCTFQWLSPMKGHPKNHVLAGFKFINLNPQAKKSLESLFEKLRELAARP